MWLQNLLSAVAMFSLNAALLFLAFNVFIVDFLGLSHAITFLQTCGGLFLFNQATSNLGNLIILARASSSKVA